MHFFRDSGISSVLESSFTPRKLRLSGRCFFALTKKITIFRGALNSFLNTAEPNACYTQVFC